ncbi:MAG: ComF family protein [Bacteroidetes bacterium]|nr:ComF family protein [Bacteroidota bacterium]MBL6944920.1 ComF family protein [Bacteroidales bacterium]
MWITDFLNLFFPNNCQACGKPLVRKENIICLSCLYKLPKTNFHFHINNPISRIFWGRANIHAATSFLFFNKGGNVQNLIHQLKYRGNTETGRHLGELLGKDLKKSNLFNNIDLIIPVPLHPKKLHKRGFNQSEVIAEGIGYAMDVPVNADELQRTEHTETQTKKTRYTRWENVKGKFRVVNPENLAGKNILLIDDVLTTGATLESCAQTLLEVPKTIVSIATLAYAQV